MLIAGSLLFVSGFLGGFWSRRHLKAYPPDHIRSAYLMQMGDASPAVRAEVLQVLRHFQDGYVKRDVTQLDPFMKRLFPDSEEVLMLGTGSLEWMRGYASVRQLVKSDWQYWGDARFAIDDSIIWASGDVAWVATVGTVSSSGIARTARLTAVLTRSERGWLFRQIHLQWDEGDGGPQELFRRQAYVNLLSHLWALCDSWIGSKTVTKIATSN